jgi:hypothetical protein
VIFENETGLLFTVLLVTARWEFVSNILWANFSKIFTTWAYPRRPFTSLSRACSSLYYGFALECLEDGRLENVKYPGKYQRLLSVI